MSRSLLLFCLLLAFVSAPVSALAADNSQPLVYVWDPASFKPTAATQATPVKRPSGDTSLCISTTGKEWNNYIQIPPGTLKGGRIYTAILKYEVVTPTTHPGTFYMFAPSKSLGQYCDIWQTWLGDPSAAGVARLTLNLKPANDWEFSIGCKGPGTQIIDSFRILEGSGLLFLPAEKNPAPAADLPKLPTPTGAGPITIDPPANKSGPVLSATDFGLVADPPTSPANPTTAKANFTAICRAIDACRQKGASRLVFPKGVYRFASDDAIPFNQLRDLVLDGQGSEFIFTKLHPNVATISVRDCTRCVIQNLRLDWDWSVAPLASLCRVSNISAESLSYDLVFPDLQEKQIELVKKAPWKQFIPMDPDTLRVRSAQRLSFTVTKLVSLPGNSLRATFSQPLPLVVGQSYAIRHQYYEMSAFRIGDSSHLLFDDVVIYSMPGMGFVSRGEMSHWAFRNCRITRREGSRNPLTATADGFHVTESLGNLLLENCQFTGLGDDCINIHDNCHQGIQRVDDHTLTLVGNNRWRFHVEAGHQIELFHADFSPLGYQSRVQAVTYKGNDTILTLDQSLPANLSRRALVFNQHYRSSNVRIANCRFYNTSGRGVLTDAHNLTIEDCVFDHTFGQGIQLAIDIVPPLWAEGAPTRNVVIRRNRFDSVNAAARADGAAICTFTRWPAGITSYPLYRDILLVQNQFLNTTGPAIAMRNCQNVLVRDNLITTVNMPATTSPLAASIFAASSSNLQIQANRWETGATPVQPGVLYDPHSCSNINATGNSLMQP